MKKILEVLFLFSLGLLVVSCGGGGNGGGGGQVHVSVSPSTVNVIAGQTQQFAASVTGALNSAVAWSVSCSTSTCGTIDSAGLYTAPTLIPADATVTVKATSQEDTNIAGTATVSQSAVAIAISPNSNLTLISADTKQFTAAVDDAPSGHATVTWSVSGSGTIDTNGLYSAPAKVAADATVTVTATSDFDNTKKKSVTISLKAPLVTLSPGDLTLEAGATQQFTPTVSYVPTGQNGVTWDLNGMGNVSAGLYHAPMLVTTRQSAIIKTISVFDDTKSAQSVVTMDPIVIGVTPDAFTLYPEQTHQFTVAVGNHVNKTVTWNVTGTSCGGGACGTVDANGLYTAPSSISSEFTVNVVATSVADNSKADTAVVTLKPITVTVSPKTVNVPVSKEQAFAATVQGGTNMNVTWSISGTGCTGSTCGTIDLTGLYTAPPNIPIPPTVTVTATPVAAPSRFDTATVTIVVNTNEKLMGAFAFHYTGWDTNGKQVEMVGSIIADGEGNIIDGAIDVNSISGVGKLSYQTFTGTYNVNGSDNRGTITLNLPSGSLIFRFALDALGEKAYLQRFQSGIGYGSGVMKKMTLLNIALNGNFVMGVTGSSYSGEREAAIGRMTVSTAGVVSNAAIDIAEAGGPTANTTFGGTLTMNSSTGMEYGRGTFSATVSGLEGGARSFVFYAVGPTEAFMMGSDPVTLDFPLFSGTILRQMGNALNNNAFAGYSVFYMSGIGGSPAHSIVQIGQYIMNGDGNGHANYARNMPGQQIVVGDNQTISFSVASNGRGTYSSPSFPTCVFYLSDYRAGFVMQYDSPGTTVMFGYFEPQSSETLQLTALVGTYYGGTLQAASPGSTFSTGLQHWDGNGSWTGVGDLSSMDGGTVGDQIVAGTFSITDTIHGRGAWTLTSPGLYQKVFYMVSTDKLIFLSIEPSTTNPTVEVMEQ